MMKQELIKKATIGMSKDEARNLLLNVGVGEIQSRAGYIPKKMPENTPIVVSKGFFLRDKLYELYDLPPFMNQMTKEQKHQARKIEYILKLDAQLRAFGWHWDYLTGWFEPLRNGHDRMSRMKQNEINRIVSGQKILPRLKDKS